MCILCVIQKWSRRVATMLPWLVIPLIGLWALSQLLPPAFRFEITSPRLACVFVLLVTLFWYEVLMPQLSAWRVRRNARLRERKRFEAIELQKLKKTATRRCRNCLTPYRDQNPGGGRFMCSYCGHISKRPVLDLPVPPGMGGISNNGIIKDLVGKGGKILNGKVWSENGWMCGQDWLENGNWVSGSFAGKPSSYWRKNGSGFFGGDENCLAEKSYSGVVIFACKLLTCFFLSIMWLWRKVFRISSSPRDDTSFDSDSRGVLSKKGESGTSCHESRGEKARRKAEEKRQARLEKELLEEEERKQREEVARLVEERRRLRDEKEAEKERGKTSLPAKEKGGKKEAEKKRQERKKEKDKGSSKSNSDVEEVEKKSGKESERRRESDRKSEIDRREYLKSGTGNAKNQGAEMGHGTKGIANNVGRGSTGTRYFDRMKGSFLSTSKAFSGTSFFGKGANTSPTIVKEHKSNSSVDHVHNSVYRRELGQPEQVAGKSSMNGDDKSTICPVLVEPQSRPVPKKSWQQLFTRSSYVPPSSNSNVISRPTSKFSAEVQSPPSYGQTLQAQSFDNPISFGLPSPFPISTYGSVSTSSALGFSPVIEHIFSCTGEGSHEFIPEEPEHFEDPCYVPDPVSLLGPVSESLDNFQLDLGTGFTSDTELERPRALKNVSGGGELSKPSPIESPMSRLRVSDDKHTNSNRFPSSPMAHDMHLPVDDTHVNEKGTWQMWNSSPLGQAGLSLVGGLLNPESGRSSKEDFVHSSVQKNTGSLFTKDDQVLSGSCSPRGIFLGNGQNGGTFSPVSGSSGHDPWVEKAFFPPLSGSENQFSLACRNDTSENGTIFGSPNRSATNHPYELSPNNCWSKKEWSVQGSGEGVGKSPVARPVGGLFSTSDVQSLW